jgi:hypothetical protein
VEPTQTATPTVEPTQTATPTATEGAGDGFGPLTALLALVAGAAAIRSRD